MMKGDKLGRQGGSGSQEQPRREIMKGGRQGGSGSQEQPRREIMKEDKFGRQGGSGVATKPLFRKSVAQSLRSKYPYSFQLSGERRETNEEGRLGAAAISVISMQGDKRRETNEEGRLGAAAISVISMQGDKWRETNEGWETRRQRQPRAAQKGNHEGRQVWETRWQRCSDQAAISEISSPVIEK